MVCARAQGISRLCNVDECRRLCPDVKLVHVQTIDKDGLTEKPSRSAKVRNTTPPTHVPYHLSLGDVCMTRTLYTRVLQVTLERYRVERLVLAELATRPRVVWVASTSLALATVCSSAKIMALFEKWVGTQQMERASIDEVRHRLASAAFCRHLVRSLSAAVLAGILGCDHHGGRADGRLAAGGWER